MTRSFGNVIADSLEHGVRYADRLLADITPDRFARFAAPGGEPVASNHAAFIYGHLSLYGPRIVTAIGGDFAAPGDFTAAFSKDAVCQDDPDGTLYPPMESVIAVFHESYAAAAAALRAASDEAFDGPNPAGGPLAERFPTVGSVVTFFSGGHLMLHLGQMSAWRRMMGLGPA